MDTTLLERAEHAGVDVADAPAHRMAGHPGFARIFAPARLTLGFMFPMTRVEGVFPDMRDQLAMAAKSDALGFGALWVRDVPLYDPGFGDVGQVYDPWVWLGQVGAVTERIALATGAVVLPLRHPLHVAKAAASVDRLTGGRFLLGLASGDRPAEFPAFGVDHAGRGERFQAAWTVVERALGESFPRLASPYGTMAGDVDLVPKPFGGAGALPLMAVGSARQSVQWLAGHADAWVTYPRDAAQQADRIAMWRLGLEQRAGGAWKPFAQSLFIDLADRPDTAPEPIFLGYRLGRAPLVEHLERLQGLGVNHVFFNLRHSRRPAAEVMEELAADVLPRFPSPAPPEGAAAATATGDAS
jgi:luciferase-type oxidoreductase